MVWGNTYQQLRPFLNWSLWSRRVESLAYQEARLTQLNQIVYSFVIIITFVLGVLKLSILCLYARMTPTRSHKLTCYTIMGCVVAHDIAALFGSMFACTPVSEFWNLTSYTIFQNPACIKLLPFDIFNSAWSAAEDVIIWMLPIPVVWGLKVSARRKMGLYFLLLVSLVSVICALVRLAVTIVWIRSADISWNYPLIPFLSNMEACVAIITSSVPAIQVLVRGAEPRRPLETPPTRRQQKDEPVAVEWDSQDSNTAVPSSAGETDRRSSRTWSLPSQFRQGSARVKEKRMSGQKQLTAFKSQTGMTTGPRTELKDFDEEGDMDFVPGLSGEKVLRIK